MNPYAQQALLSVLNTA